MCWKIFVLLLVVVVWNVKLSLIISSILPHCPSKSGQAHSHRRMSEKGATECY